MQCTACSTALLDDARFCHICGTPVSAAVPPPTLLPSPAAVAATPLATSLAAAALVDVRRGVRKHVTVLFADIVGSTALLTKLDPEDVRKVLVNVMFALRETIEQSGGVVAKTMGDGIFALFGAPKALENHAYLACRAALEMQRIAPTLSLAPGVPVRLRVGLNTGVAVIFMVGEGAAATLDAVGDVVNRAAHLEARAEVGKVLISRATVRQAGARIVVRNALALVETGKGADQECFELLECATDIDTVLLDSSARLLRFVGRIRERAFLEESVQSLLRGQGDRIALVGETGVGKTRLLAECLAPKADTLLQVVGLSCLATDPSDANALLRRLTGRLLGIRRSSSLQDPESVLAERISGQWPCLTPDVTALAWLLFDKTDAPSREAPERLKARAHEAIVRLIFESSRRRPLVLVFDDYQWVDESSRQFIANLEPTMPGSAALVITVTRDDDERTVAEANRTLQLAPLTHDELAELVYSSPGFETVSEQTLERLIERCAGNPGFLVEIARELQDARDAHPGRNTAPIEIPIPDSIADLFEERIDRLPEYERSVLQWLAAFEKLIECAELAALVDMPVDAVATALAALQKKGLIRMFVDDAGSRYNTANAGVAAAAYRSLLKNDRSRLHARICDRLQGRPPLPGLDTAIARHAERAGRHGIAARSYAKAGRSALSRLAYAESVALLRHALRLGEQAEEPLVDRELLQTVIALRAALFALAEFEEIGLLLDRAAAWCGSDADRNQLSRFRITNMIALGHLEQALSSGVELLAMIDAAADPVLMCDVLLLLGQIHASLGRYDTALESLQRLLRIEVTEESAVRKTELSRGLATMWCLWCASELGRFEECTAWMLQAQSDLDTQRPDIFRILAGIGTGLFWLRFGEQQLAADTLRSVLPLTDSVETAAWYPAVASPLGLALVRMGRPAEALDLLHAAVERTPSGGAGLGRAQRLANLAECVGAVGELIRAESLAREACALSVRTQEAAAEAYARFILASILHRCGRTREAMAEVAAAKSLAQRLSMSPLVKDLEVFSQSVEADG